MNMIQIKTLIAKIRAAQSIAVIMHNEPDGDTSGSALALQKLIFDNFGINPVCFYGEKFPEYLRFMPGTKNIKNSTELSNKKSFDLAIAADVATPKLLSQSLNIFENAKYKVNIDHHSTPDKYANLNIKKVCDATGVVVYNIATLAKWNISRDAATCLYTAIASDTKNFTTTDNPYTFIVAANLIKLGAMPSKISMQLNTSSKENIIANANTIGKTKFFFNDKLAITHMDVQDYSLAEDNGSIAFRGLSNMSNVDYSVVVIEKPDGSINILMQGKYNPILGIAKALGGGGHPFRAGAQPQMTPTQAELAIIREFKSQGLVL